MPRPIFSLNIDDLLRTLLMWGKFAEEKKQAERERQIQLVEAYGWPAIEKGLGTKAALDIFQNLYGKKVMPPQRTFYETVGPQPWPEGGGFTYEPVPRTEIIWPEESYQKILEKKQRELLQKPEVLQEVAEVGLGLKPKSWEEAQKSEERRIKLIEQLSKDYDWSKHPRGWMGLRETADALLSTGITTTAELAGREDQFGLPPKKVEKEKISPEELFAEGLARSEGFMEGTPEFQKRKSEIMREQFKKKIDVKEAYDVIEEINPKDPKNPQQAYIEKGSPIPKGWRIVKAVPSVSIHMEKIPESIRSAFLEAKKGKTIVDQLEEMWNKLPHYEGLVGRIHGIGIDWLSKTGLAPEVKAYQNFVNGVLAPLVRSLGEKGALTDADVQRAIALVPKYPDTKKEARLKLQDLKKLISKGFENIKEAAVLQPSTIIPETSRFEIIRVE